MHATLALLLLTFIFPLHSSGEGWDGLPAPTPPPATPCEELVTGRKFERSVTKAYQAPVLAYEAAEDRRIPVLRDQLARIENANPRGFNTYAYGRREGLRADIIS